MVGTSAHPDGGFSATSKCKERGESECGLLNKNVRGELKVTSLVPAEGGRTR
jgi:hypothetical protein